MALVLVCTAYDTATNTCTAQAWVEQPGLLPDLPVADAHAIGAAIAGLWIVAFLLRWLRKQSENL